MTQQETSSRPRTGKEELRKRSTMHAIKSVNPLTGKAGLPCMITPTRVNCQKSAMMTVHGKALPMMRKETF